MDALTLNIIIFAISAVSTIVFGSYLAKYGDVRFWCDSNLYNTIENTHQIWLLAIIDYVIANKE